MIKISVCNHKTDKKYKNQERPWSYLKERNRTPVRTSETAEEYPKLPKTQRDAVTDHGGFVGGWLQDGIRKNGNVLCRTIGMLGADRIPQDIDFPAHVKQALSGIEHFLYSTHSHTPAAPRFQVAIRLGREVSEDEYPALMRTVAKQIGMDYFDDTTYQSNRMIYWSSCPSNGEFIFAEHDGDPLDPDQYLAMYDVT